MYRRILISCFALTAATGFLVQPASASASPELTFPTGTRLATGSLLQVTNFGVARFSDGINFPLECPTAKFTGTLATNSGSSVQINFSSMKLEGLGKEGDCASEKEEFKRSVKVTYSNLPWCFKAPALGNDSFEYRGGKCGEEPKPVTLILNITGGPECKYEAASIRGTFKTHPEDAKLEMVSELKGESSNSFLCATSLSTETAMTMERDSLVAEPVYIS
jgi:hypothetical protein